MLGAACGTSCKDVKPHYKYSLRGLKTCKSLLTLFMSLSFEHSLEALDSYRLWADPINNDTWSYSYLVVNSTGTYAVSDAYYENNTFASTWLNPVSDEWKDLRGLGTNELVDIYDSREEAINYILSVYDVETFAETRTTSDEVLELQVQGSSQNLR